MSRRGSRRRRRRVQCCATTDATASVKRHDRPCLIVWHCSAKLQSGVQLLTACRDCLRRKYEVRIQRNAFVLIDAGFYGAAGACSYWLCCRQALAGWAVSRRTDGVQAPHASLGLTLLRVRRDVDESRYRPINANITAWGSKTGSARLCGLQRQRWCT